MRIQHRILPSWVAQFHFSEITYFCQTITVTANRHPPNSCVLQASTTSSIKLVIKRRTVRVVFLTSMHNNDRGGLTTTFLTFIFQLCSHGSEDGLKFIEWIHPVMYNNSWLYQANTLRLIDLCRNDCNDWKKIPHDGITTCQWRRICSACTLILCNTRIPQNHPQAVSLE